MKILYSFFIFLLFATTAIAQDVKDQNNGLKYLLELSASFGGGEFGTIQFENDEEQKILSGNGLTFAAGIDYPLPVNQLGIKAALGYKVSFSKADNADIKKSVIPLDVIPYYQIKNHKIGAGVTYHINPTMDWDTLGPKWEFDNAMGFTAEYSYKFTSIQLSASYSIIEYEESSLGKIDASHVSIKLAFLL